MVTICILAILWILMAVTVTMRFDVTPRYSPSERARLTRQGDQGAQEEARKLEIAPLLISLQYCIRTLLISVFIAICVLEYGAFSGILVGTAAVLVLPLVFRASFIDSLSNKLHDILLPWFTKFALFAKPVLRALRPRDEVLVDMTLNSQDELLALIQRSPGVLSSKEQERLVASLQFDDKRVGDIMTPRTMIDAVPVDETLGPLVLDELYKTGHSRFPVYKNDLDHVVGMLYLHDLLDLRQGSQPTKAAMKQKVYFIREDKNLSHALHGFLMSRHHLFVVVNKYRETVGLLSLEDVIETLLGTTIQDEFDAFDDLRAVAEHNPHKNNQPRSREDI